MQRKGNSVMEVVVSMMDQVFTQVPAKQGVKNPDSWKLLPEFHEPESNQKDNRRERC